MAVSLQVTNPLLVNPETVRERRLYTGDDIQVGSSVISFLSERVAKWWLPDDVVFVDELPHTATGKVSKLNLRKQLEDYKLPSAD